MLTIKLKYETTKENKQIIFNFQKNQNNVVKFLFNRLQEDETLSHRQLYNLARDKMNNIFIDSWFRDSAVDKARSMYSSMKESENKSVIFGSKKLFTKRCQHKISREKFQKEKVSPLYSLGEKHSFGNRKLELDVANNKILLKLTRDIKIVLSYKNNLSKTHQKYLDKLQELTKLKKLPLTFSIDQEYIYLTFDELELTGVKEINKKKNRIMSLDLNPNYVGYSIIDWTNQDKFKIIKSGILSNKEINDKQKDVRELKWELKKQGVDREARIEFYNKKNSYIKNKRSHEIVEVVKKLVNIAKSYNVENFSIEKLDMKPKDHGKGKRYNRLTNNNWNRNLFKNQLIKRLKFYGIDFYEILPQYSSFVGNIFFRNLRLPDQILASIEMNRRTYCFVQKYVLQNKEIYKVIFPSFCSNKKVISISLEEIGYDPNRTENWKDLYKKIKTLKIRYKVSLAEAKPPAGVFRLSSLKSLVKVFDYD